MQPVTMRKILSITNDMDKNREIYIYIYIYVCMYVCMYIITLRFFLLTAFYISKQHHEQQHSAPALSICASE